jgi:hypothetical protein
MLTSDDRRARQHWLVTLAGHTDWTGEEEKRMVQDVIMFPDRPWMCDQ